MVLQNLKTLKMPPPTPPPPKSLSRRKVTCSECGDSFDRYAYLEQHFERRHPGKQCREKNQTSLVELMKAGTKRGLPEDLGDQTEPDDDTSPENSIPPPQTSAPTQSVDDVHASTSSVASSSSVISQDNSEAAESGVTSITDHSLFLQIQKVLNQFSESSKSGTPLSSSVPTPLVTQTQQAENDSQTKDRVKACRCLKDFETLLDDVFRLDRETNRLVCLTCEKSESDKYGIFMTADIEFDNLPTKSRKFRNLQTNILAHLHSEFHIKQEEMSQKAEEDERRKRQKNREIGRKLGSLAYFIYYNKLPFLFFEKILPWMALVEINIGQVNHSEIFLRRLLEPCFSELKKRLQQHLNKPLPCTDELRPFNLTADKGTIKHDCNQVTMIRTPALKNGHIFEKFFIAHPEVHCHKGFEISELLLKACSEQLNMPIEEIRRRFSGGCFDGQYIRLNVKKHLGELLHLPDDFLEDAILWDTAHRLELASDDAKKGKKDQRGNWIIKPAPWLQELDSVLQHIMTKFRFGANHSDLRQIAKEMGLTFLEFCLFSDTRFIEYVHRTYDHTDQMFPVLHKKFKKDESNANTQKEVDDSEALEKLLVQAKTVTDLLFMKEVSQFMTFCSKSFQKFDTLPFEPMHKLSQLKDSLEKAKRSFEDKKVPDSIKIVFPDSHTYTAWSYFKSSVDEICESQTFKGIVLLVPGDRGRVTRSGVQYGYDKEAFCKMVHSRYSHYANYLGELLASLKQRFEPWKNWVCLSDDVFNFANELTMAERQASLKSLMECPFGPTPYVQEEKNRISAEYVTFQLNAERATNSLKATKTDVSQSELWYELLTNEKYFKDTKKFNAFALLFLTRSFNEGIVEVEVSSLKNVATERRPLNQSTVEMLNFISTNGPHPLVAMNLVDDFLNAHFGKDWHFTINQSKWFVSKTVDRHFKLARELPNSLA